MQMMPRPKQARAHTFDPLGMLILLAALAAPIALFVLGHQASREPARVAVIPPAPKQLAEVVKLARDLKIITATVESVVTTRVVDEKWRGTASAVVEAPVKYSFGVDLSKIDGSSIHFDDLAQGFVLKLPPPTLLAAEVDTAHPIHERIEVSGTRFKALAGQEQLILAQQALSAEARKQSLPPAQQEEVRRITREQVQKMLGLMMADSGHIQVGFSD